MQNRRKKVLQLPRISLRMKPLLKNQALQAPETRCKTTPTAILMTGTSMCTERRQEVGNSDGYMYWFLAY